MKETLETPGDRPLDLQVRMPKKYRLVTPPDSSQPLVAGEDAQAILRGAIERIYLTLPLRQSDLKQALGATWYYTCRTCEIPFCTIEVADDWSGQISYDFRTMGTAMPRSVYQVMHRELLRYARLPEIQKFSKGKCPFLVTPVHGVVLFPNGGYEPLQLVLSYVEEVRNRTWLSRAPHNDALPELPETEEEDEG